MVSGLAMSDSGIATSRYHGLALIRAVRAFAAPSCRGGNLTTMAVDSCDLRVAVSCLLYGYAVEDDPERCGYRILVL